MPKMVCFFVTRNSKQTFVYDSPMPSRGDHMKTLTLLFGLIFVLFAECSQGAAKQPSSAQKNNQNAVYENQYMKVVLRPGWTARKTRANPAAVNIVKAN